MNHTTAAAEAGAWVQEAARLAERGAAEGWSTALRDDYNAAVQLAQAYALIAQAGRP